MKKIAPVLFLLFVAAAIVVLAFYWSATAPPESASIARERSRLSQSLDKTRMENDPVYARGHEMKLQNLDYLLAKAYINENMPDDAVGLLQKLISDEEAKNANLTRRRFRSCRNEASFYEALEQAKVLKQDNAGVERARQSCRDLLAEAQAAKKQEQLEEGKSLRLAYGD